MAGFAFASGLLTGRTCLADTFVELVELQLPLRQKLPQYSRQADSDSFEYSG